MKNRKAKKRFSCHFIRKSEVKAVAAIHSEAFYSIATSSVKEKVDGKTEGCVVAKNHKGTVVGYIFFDIESDNKMYVANVGVHKKHRGKGVCGRMIKWLTKRLQKFDCKMAYLSVAKENESAKSCYTSRGFTAKDDTFMIRMEYWPNGESTAQVGQEETSTDTTGSDKPAEDCAPCENVESIRPRLTGLFDDSGWGE